MGKGCGHHAVTYLVALVVLPPCKLQGSRGLRVRRVLGRTLRLGLGFAQHQRRLDLARSRGFSS